MINLAFIILTLVQLMMPLILTVIVQTKDVMDSGECLYWGLY